MENIITNKNKIKKVFDASKNIFRLLKSPEFIYHWT